MPGRHANATNFFGEKKASTIRGFFPRLFFAQAKKGFFLSQGFLSTERKAYLLFHYKNRSIK